jgi:hypothetical protein
VDNKSVFDLVMRLNNITRELDGLALKEMTLIKEYDEIVYELWRRNPALETNVDIQPKRKVRKKDV